MPRVRFLSVSVLCLIVVGMCRIEPVNADCWYNNGRYEEGGEVLTGEPCLNCTCNRGIPVCYLRVCPRLPNPPPQGCILLHRYRTCCPELICEDRPLTGNRIEARSEADDFDLYDKSILANACFVNGSIYGPGSAMDSSTLCEYCYCLGGLQRCVKPKCLLPIEGCHPTYDPDSCCPVRYNCTEMAPPSTSTTTSSPEATPADCLVSGQSYREGGKILGVGHSACDNCYCIRGLVRCEPLSCAAPLLGCLPVIKPGECCAASYNCSGTIETRPEPNYGNFPVVSKEYAKLRKEAQQKIPAANRKWGYTTKSTYYVMAETPKSSSAIQYRLPGLSGTTRHFSGHLFNASTPRSFSLKSSIAKATARPEMVYKANATTFPGVYYATTNYEFHNVTYQRPVVSTTNRPKNEAADQLLAPYETVNSILAGGKVFAEAQKRDDSWLDGRFNRRIDETTRTDEEDESTTTTTTATSDTPITTTLAEVTTYVSENATTFLPSSVQDVIKSIVLADEGNSSSNAIRDDVDPQQIDNWIGSHEDADSDFTSTTTDSSTTTTEATTSFSSSSLQNSVIVRTVKNSTDCTEDEAKPNETLELKAATVSTDFDLTTRHDDVTIVDLESKVKVSTVTLHPYHKLPHDLLALAKDKDSYYDYDFQPTLPPSLPNLRIIPFLPSDALDAKKKVADKKVGYPPLVDERVTDPNVFTFPNLFSPPIETEGGFVPKAPPLLDNFYDNTYHTTGVEVNAVTSVPAPSMNNRPKADANSCVTEGGEIRHGNSVASKNACVACVCYYGDVICQEPQCPLPSPSCRKSNVLEMSTCCPHLICDDEESPTVVLDRIDVTSSPRDVITMADGIVSPDPFRDVIRTEPAPNLQTLVVDMMAPFFTRQATMTSPTHPNKETRGDATTTSTNTKITTITTEPSKMETNGGELSLEKVLELLLGDKEEEATPKSAEASFLATTQNDRRQEEEEGVTNKLEVRENDTDNLIRPALSNELSPGVGLLKLAGCNIYGRMYRVGKIIAELSGPCLECKCTDVGVQCTPLC